MTSTKTRRAWGPAVLLQACILTGCAASPTRPVVVNRGDYDAVKQHVESVVRHEMRKHDVTGLSVALVDDQRVVWAQGFGWADREKKLPATPETVYRVGSISKLFTATAAMQLAERRRLDIEERGFLIVEAAMRDEPGQVLRLPLMPISDSEAILLGQLQGVGEVVRWTAGPEGGQVAFAGYTLRRIDH